MKMAVQRMSDDWARPGTPREWSSCSSEQTSVPSISAAHTLGTTVAYAYSNAQVGPQLTSQASRGIEDTAQDNCFLVVGVITLELCRGLDLLHQARQAKNGFGAVFKETLRAKKFGFTSTELERQKKEIARFLEENFF